MSARVYSRRGVSMGATGTAGLLVGLAAVVASVSPAEPQQVPPVFGVDVRLVAVPVFVTDKDGRAVSGLTAQDFEVEDSGRSVPVSGFLAVDAAVKSGTLPDASASPRLIAAARRQFLLLFDLTFSNPAGILKARKAALELLENGPQPGDLVAAAKFGPGGVEVLLGFTPDRAQVARAVATMGGGEGGARLRDPLALAYDLGFAPKDPSGKWGLEIEGNSRDPDFYRDTALLLARSERAAYRQRVLSYVGELQRLAQLLDSVQGRKQVILLSGGFDQSVLTGAEGTEQADASRAVVEGRLWEVQGDRRFGDAGARSTLDGLYEALARTDTVVHTVDVMGMVAGGALDETGSAPRGSGRGTLAEFAGRSGGRFVREGNDIATGLREVMDASRYYYVLAFEPTDAKKKPGELRKLKVKVKRPGLEISHRAGYTLPDLKAVSAPTAQLQAADMIAKGISGGALRLRAVAVPYRSAQGAVSLPVVLEIEGETLLAAAGKTLSLEIYGYALDADGRIQDALGLTPTLEIEKLGAAIRQKGIQVLTAFRVGEGPVDLRFLVRDPASGRSGSLRIASVVPSFADGALVLSPPLFMDDPRARLVIPTPSRANRDLQIPFRVGEAPFTPQASPVLHEGEAREVCLMVYGGAGADGSAALKAALVRDDGQALTLETGALRVVNDADRFRRLVMSLTPRGVPAGDYRLRLTVPASDGAEDSRSEMAVRVN
jgi:VWFA-related protein